MTRSDATSPLSRASLWSQFWFGWNKPLLDLGRKRPLISSDLPPLDEEDQSRHAREYIEKLWAHEREAAGGKRKASLARAMALDYFRTTWTSRLLIVLNSLVKIGQAVFLGILLDRLEDPQGSGAYIWAAAIIGCGLIAFPTKQHSFFMLYRKGNQFRTGLTAAIYAKTLRLPSIRNHDSTTYGRLTNLASNDIERFVLTAIYVNLLIASPVEISTILVVGIWTIGPVFCFGYALLIMVLVPLQFWLSRRFVFLRHKVAHLTDARVTMVSQAITGARVLKLQGWELELERKISDVRTQEVKQLQMTNRLKACNDAIYYVSSLVVSVSVLALYVGGLGGTLTPRIVFTSFTLWNLLQYSVTKHIPNAIMGLSECFVSCQRIQTFLDLPEQQEEHSSLRVLEGVKNETPCLEISDATTCYWDSTNTTSTPTIALKTMIPLSFYSGKLYCVIGKVGSGKSAFLQALIGELPTSSGSIHRHVSKSISYAAQDPWIMDGTARQNITMGLPFDLNWYNSVVRACSLESDFNSFPQGDETIVGDRGVQCSGGQKARLALARAIYCDSDILVLDDPLSAVDAKVARTIYSGAIQELGLQRGKCVILATHQLQFAVANEHCILLDAGKLVCCASFSECISKSSVDLSEALQADATLAPDDDIGTTRDYAEETRETEFMQTTTVDSFAEKRQTGVISKRTWLSYVEALGGSVVFALFLLVFSATQAIFLTTMTYVGLWAQAPEDEQITGRWFGIVLGLTTGTVTIAIVRAQLSFHLFLQASKKLHNAMLFSVLRATIEFYDTNPLGRVLNRFASDVGIIDEQLPLVVYDFGVGFIMFVASIITAMTILPLVLAVFPFLLWAFVRLRQIFVMTTRELKRLEGLGKSPIYAMMSETMDGIGTIRTNSKHAYFSVKFESLHDNLIKAQFAFIAVSRWFATKLDFLSFLFLTTSTLSAVIISDQGWFNLDPAVLGLALSLLLQLAGANFPYMVRQSAEVTNQMVSVERVWEFGHSIPQEAPLFTDFDKDLMNWPEEPSVTVSSVSARYRENLPLCLEDVSFTIKPGERVGVVGRTGAGKTSLLQVMFRVLEVQNGSIFIGGVDTSKLGLHKLRTSMAVITQSPVLFSGCTVRENLDPYPQGYGELEDKRLENALRAVHMWEAIQSIPDGLDGVVREGGSNFSVGQRQLLCLARALLSNNRILVLDEATANVDQATDSLVQQTLRERFNTATIIAIAHRLDTIIDYDKVLVLGNGKVLEFGPPAQLLDRHGHFTSMVESTGQAMASALRQKVKNDNRLDQGNTD